MKKKTTVILIVSGVALIIISTLIGMLYAKNETQENTPSPTPYELFPDNAEEVISNSVTEHNEYSYKITLAGTELLLYEKDKVICETKIAPDVLPRADVKALTDGIEYLTIEEALIDWESLSN